MEEVTTERKTGGMVEEFVAAKHTFMGPNEQLKGELQDLMGWGDIIVVDHQGLVIGMARDCVPVDSPLTLAYNFDSAKYDEYLKFAHQHECVMVVRSDSKATGICVFSHTALNQEAPECYHIMDVRTVTGKAARAPPGSSYLTRVHPPFTIHNPPFVFIYINRRRTSSKRSSSGRRAPLVCEQARCRLRIPSSRPWRRSRHSRPRTPSLRARKEQRKARLRAHAPCSSNIHAVLMHHHSGHALTAHNRSFDRLQPTRLYATLRV